MTPTTPQSQSVQAVIEDTLKVNELSYTRHQAPTAGWPA